MQKTKIPSQKSKRRKINEVYQAEMEAKLKVTQAEEQPTQKGRKYTVSLALPGTIIENAQSAELRTYLAGQIGRALAIFNIDEVVIFNDSTSTAENNNETVVGEFKGAGNRNFGDGNVFLARVLQYLETPQYLRKALFPKHPDLNYAGLLNPLDCPHHLRRTEKCRWREGVTVGAHENKQYTRINAGIQKEVLVERAIKPNVRVTVEFKDGDRSFDKRYWHATVASQKAPRETAGIYWGYRVRLASGLKEVFDGCPFENGYDLKIGTSERGNSVDDLSKDSFPDFQHALIVFGGVEGLEKATESNEELNSLSGGIENMFDLWLNVCPQQGSRTIRTEEAILVAMSGLRPLLTIKGQ